MTEAQRREGSHGPHSPCGRRMIQAALFQASTQQAGPVCLLCAGQGVWLCNSPGRPGIGF